MGAALVTLCAVQYLMPKHLASNPLSMIKRYSEVYSLTCIFSSIHTAIKQLSCCLKIPLFLYVLVFGDGF